MYSSKKKSCCFRYLSFFFCCFLFSSEKYFIFYAFPAYLSSSFFSHVCPCIKKCCSRFARIIFNFCLLWKKMYKFNLYHPRSSTPAVNATGFTSPVFPGGAETRHILKRGEKFLQNYFFILVKLPGRRWTLCKGILGEKREILERAVKVERFSCRGNRNRCHVAFSLLIFFVCFLFYWNHWRSRSRSSSHVNILFLSGDKRFSIKWYSTNTRSGKRA